MTAMNTLTTFITLPVGYFTTSQYSIAKCFNRRGISTSTDSRKIKSLSFSSDLLAVSVRSLEVNRGIFMGPLARFQVTAMSAIRKDYKGDSASYSGIRNRKTIKVVVPYEIRDKQVPTGDQQKKSADISQKLKAEVEVEISFPTSAQKIDINKTDTISNWYRNVLCEVTSFTLHREPNQLDTGSEKEANMHYQDLPYSVALDVMKEVILHGILKQYLSNFDESAENNKESCRKMVSKMVPHRHEKINNTTLPEKKTIFLTPIAEMPALRSQSLSWKTFEKISTPVVSSLKALFEKQLIKQDKSMSDNVNEGPDILKLYNQLALDLLLHDTIALHMVLGATIVSPSQPKDIQHNIRRQYGMQPNIPFSAVTTPKKSGPKEPFFMPGTMVTKMLKKALAKKSSSYLCIPVVDKNFGTWEKQPNRIELNSVSPWEFIKGCRVNPNDIASEINGATPAAAWLILSVIKSRMKGVNGEIGVRTLQSLPFGALESHTPHSVCAVSILGEEGLKYNVPLLRLLPGNIVKDGQIPENGNPKGTCRGAAQPIIGDPSKSLPICQTATNNTDNGLPCTINPTTAPIPAIGGNYQMLHTPQVLTEDDIEGNLRVGVGQALGLSTVSYLHRVFSHKSYNIQENLRFAKRLLNPMDGVLMSRMYAPLPFTTTCTEPSNTEKDTSSRYLFLTLDEVGAGGYSHEEIQDLIRTMRCYTAIEKKRRAEEESNLPEPVDPNVQILFRVMPPGMRCEHLSDGSKTIRSCHDGRSSEDEASRPVPVIVCLHAKHLVRALRYTNEQTDGLSGIKGIEVFHDFLCIGGQVWCCDTAEYYISGQNIGSTVNASDNSRVQIALNSSFTLSDSFAFFRNDGSNNGSVSSKPSSGGAVKANSYCDPGVTRKGSFGLLSHLSSIHHDSPWLTEEQQSQLEETYVIFSGKGLLSSSQCSASKKESKKSIITTSVNVENINKKTSPLELIFQSQVQVAAHTGSLKAVLYRMMCLLATEEMEHNGLAVAVRKEKKIGSGTQYNEYGANVSYPVVKSQNRLTDDTLTIQQHHDRIQRECTVYHSLILDALLLGVSANSASSSSAQSYNLVEAAAKSHAKSAITPATFNFNSSLQVACALHGGCVPIHLIQPQNNNNSKRLNNICVTSLITAHQPLTVPEPSVLNIEGIVAFAASAAAKVSPGAKIPFNPSRFNSYLLAVANCGLFPTESVKSKGSSVDTSARNQYIETILRPIWDNYSSYANESLQSPVTPFFEGHLSEGTKCSILSIIRVNASISRTKDRNLGSIKSLKISYLTEEEISEYHVNLKRELFCSKATQQHIVISSDVCVEGISSRGARSLNVILDQIRGADYKDRVSKCPSNVSDFYLHLKKYILRSSASVNPMMSECGRYLRNFILVMIDGDNETEKAVHQAGVIDAIHDLCSKIERRVLKSKGPFYPKQSAIILSVTESLLFPKKEMTNKKTGSTGKPVQAKTKTKITFASLMDDTYSSSLRSSDRTSFSEVDPDRLRPLGFQLAKKFNAKGFDDVMIAIGSRIGDNVSSSIQDPFYTICPTSKHSVPSSQRLGSFSGIIALLPYAQRAELTLALDLHQGGCIGKNGLSTIGDGGYNNQEGGQGASDTVIELFISSFTQYFTSLNRQKEETKQKAVLLEERMMRLKTYVSEQMNSSDLSANDDVKTRSSYDDDDLDIFESENDDNEVNCINENREDKTDKEFNVTVNDSRIESLTLDEIRDHFHRCVHRKIQCDKRVDMILLPKMQNIQTVVRGLKALQAHRGAEKIRAWVVPESGHISKSLVDTYVQATEQDSDTDRGAVSQATTTPLPILRPSFIHNGTSTGRLICRNPNLQNIPKGDIEFFSEANVQGSKDVYNKGDEMAKRFSLRNLFVSRFAGAGTEADSKSKDTQMGYIVEMDYSQLEPVAVAALSCDPVLVDEISRGVDQHCKRVALLKKKPYEEVFKLCKVVRLPDYVQERQKMKVFSFQRQYGAGPQTISTTTGLPLHTVKRLIEEEKVIYCGIEEMHRIVSESTTKTGGDIIKQIRSQWMEKEKVNFIHKIESTATNGAGVFPTASGSIFSFSKGVSSTRLKNHPTQGFAAELVQVALGLCFLHSIISRRRQKIGQQQPLLINTVHDSLWFDVPPGAPVGALSCDDGSPDTDGKVPTLSAIHPQLDEYKLLLTSILKVYRGTFCEGKEVDNDDAPLKPGATFGNVNLNIETSVGPSLAYLRPL